MTDSQSPAIPEEIQAPAASSPLPGFVGRLAQRPFAVLALLGLLLWLPGIVSMPALDRDESRFAQSSRQMIESGNPVDIRFGHVPRYKKPVGIYWLQASATMIAGLGDDSRIWTYRLPSVFGAIAAAWLTVWCALALTGAEAAFLAGLLMLSSVLLTAEASIATTDAVLLASVLTVQGVLLRVYRAARDSDAPPISGRLIFAGWAAVAGGALVKFPVMPGVAIATIAALCAWDRDARWLLALKPVRGFLLAVLLISPWMIAISLQSDGAFLEQSLGNDFAAKIAGGQESHGMWPGYFLLLSALTFFPSILFVPPGLVCAVARRNEAGIRFLLCWAGAWWILVEAVPTKLPHYVLPAYPALAILAAIGLISGPMSAPWLVRWLPVARWVGIVQFLIGAALLAAAPVVFLRYFGTGIVWWVVALSVSGSVAALVALILWLRQAPAWSVLSGLMAMLIFVPAITVAAAPRLDGFWVSNRLKHLVAAASQPGDPSPALAGYQEPSLVFALGADVELTNGAGAADTGTKSGGLALVEDAEQGAFLARLAELQGDAHIVGDLSGFNYSRGRKVHITLYRVVPLREPG